jgi:hypothetical protein
VKHHPALQPVSEEDSAGPKPTQLLLLIAMLCGGLTMFTRVSALHEQLHLCKVGTDYACRQPCDPMSADQMGSLAVCRIHCISPEQSGLIS